MKSICITTMFLMLTVVAVASCNSATAAFTEAGVPCKSIQPPPVVSHTAGQRIPVSRDAPIFVLAKSETWVYAGPESNTRVVDPHAQRCNLYLPLEGVVRGGRLHVAQIYRISDGSFVALWNRSGWVTFSLLRQWR